jgi:Bacterial Ig-like domain (group 2).
VSVLPSRSLDTLIVIFTCLVTSCGELVSGCSGDVLRVQPTVPDTITIRVGASAIATAGEAYSTCDIRPARRYDWRVSDESIVAISPLDSTRVRITALNAGEATVTPTYKASGAGLSGVSVTVVR